MNEKLKALDELPLIQRKVGFLISALAYFTFNAGFSMLSIRFNPLSADHGKLKNRQQSLPLSGSFIIIMTSEIFHYFYL